MKNEVSFYSDLTGRSISVSKLIADASLMVDIPASWHVVITDIRGSTQAISEGRHEEVNRIATGSIVIVLNIAFRSGISIPFFFGGDGVTFMVPDTMIDQVMESLAGYRDQAMEKHTLYLRIGYVPVLDIYQSGYYIKVAKYYSSGNFVIPVVTGFGLAYAENKIKNMDDSPEYKHFFPKQPDLNGMQCRWDRIGPPANNTEILTLLVSCRDLRTQADDFAAILSKIEDLYGPFNKRQPISVAELKLKSTFKQLQTEENPSNGKTMTQQFFRTWLNTIYCHFYFKTRSGRAYLQRIVEMSDTLVIDGRINTVISGTAVQREQLLQYLDGMEQNGTVVYGFHISSSTIMSCYVQNSEYGHIHFVDGAEGGYTQAAVILKRKLLAGSKPKV
jgi:Protein of unknown function (DUF3095)